MSLLLSRVLDLRSNVAAVAEAVELVKRHRLLVFEMTRRELLDRYIGSSLGGIWTIVTPLLLLGTYVFAFMYIMRLRLHIGDGGLPYTIFVLSAMIVWLGVQETLGRATSAVVSDASLVKQIVFPAEVLPLKVALASLPSLGVGVAIVIALDVLDHNFTFIGIFVLFPIACLSYVIMVSGLVYALAALGVFFRDVKDIINVLLQVGVFVHPIFYPPTSIPHWLQSVFALSPFSHLIWCFRDALFYGKVDHPWSWLIAPVCGVIFFSLGWRIFRTMRPTFGNVL